MDQTIIEKHSTLQSITLHLLPGILIGCFYFLTRHIVIDMGFPAIFALALAVIFVLIPFELGFILFQGKKKTGRLTLDGVLGYRNPIPWWQYIVWPLVVFGLTGLIFTLMKPVDVWLQQNLFFWVPDMNNGLDGNYSRTSLIITYSFLFIFVNILGPIVEELYFRGYLLPRIQGRLAPVLNSFLFAVYHVFTPWMIITRTIGFLPMIYTVTKKNIGVGMIIHILCNTVDVMTGFVFISSMT